MRGAGRPVWDDIASDDDLAALSPPSPARPPERPDVLVVGGGVVGLAVAACCTRAGLDVLLVEREERLAMCASGRAAGGLSPDAHPELGPRWRALARKSLMLHRELDAAWDYGLRDVGLLVLPDFAIPSQGHVDPLRFCAALARHAGTIATGTAYEALTDVRPSHTVFATGAARDDAVVGGQSYVKGHLLATEPLSPVLDGVVSDGRDLLALQLPSGHIVSGGTKDRDVAEPDVDDTVCEGIVAWLHEAVPATRGKAITHRWTCFRPLAPEALPVVRRVREDVWCAAGLYSTGILMAPVIGDAVARAIVQGAELPVFVD
jgi:glycine/D-amino acid oxidase-like deaminating enzyme